MLNAYTLKGNVTQDDLRKDSNKAGTTHQCHFKVVSCGCVIQFNIVLNLLITEMSPEVFLLLNILENREKKRVINKKKQA